MRHFGRRGFSLVELLIVIGIILLLLAILLPALNAAREHAKRVNCMSNMRQLTAAWLMYANDNRGRFCSSEIQDVTVTGVSSINGGAPVRNGFFWSWIADGEDHHDFTRGMLWPYLKSTGVYLCPNDPFPPNTIYALNRFLAGSANIPQGAQTFYTLSQVHFPDHTLVFIEAFADEDSNFNDADDEQDGGPRIESSFNPPFYSANPFNFKFNTAPGKYHPLGLSNGTPISFIDGHVLFWQFADVRTATYVSPTAIPFVSNPDVTQLAAWSGGPVPPGATP